MSDELKEMFEELRDFDWLSTYQDFVDEIREKVEEELKRGRQAELEKITDRIDDCITNCKKQSVRNGYERGIVIGMSGCIDIINEHIAELKGENNEQT